MRKRNAQRFLPGFESPAALLSPASARISALAPRSIPSSVRYQTFRSISSHEQPSFLTNGPRLGDWRHCSEAGSVAGRHRGAVEALKPEYRLALARDAYMLVRCEAAVFKPAV